MTKQEIALGQLRWACEAGLPRGVLLADSAYGSDGKFRSGIRSLGLTYVVGIQAQTLVWLPGRPKPTRTRPLSPPEQLWRWCKRNPLVAGLNALQFDLLKVAA